jgi:hypothetical protein
MISSETHDQNSSQIVLCFSLAVVYDGCPRSFSRGLWWERTPFGKIALESCPSHSQGKASRACDETLGGWQEPDLFNCTSDPFLDLRKVVSCVFFCMQSQIFLKMLIKKGEYTYFNVKLSDKNTIHSHHAVQIINLFFYYNETQQDALFKLKLSDD